MNKGWGTWASRLDVYLNKTSQSWSRRAQDSGLQLRNIKGDPGDGGGTGTGVYTSVQLSSIGVGCINELQHTVTWNKNIKKLLEELLPMFTLPCTSALLLLHALLICQSQQRATVC